MKMEEEVQAETPTAKEGNSDITGDPEGLVEEVVPNIEPEAGCETRRDGEDDTGCENGNAEINLTSDKVINEAATPDVVNEQVILAIECVKGPGELEGTGNVDLSDDKIGDTDSTVGVGESRSCNDNAVVDVISDGGKEKEGDKNTKKTEEKPEEKAEEKVDLSGVKLRAKKVKEVVRRNCHSEIVNDTPLSDDEFKRSESPVVRRYTVIEASNPENKEGDKRSRRHVGIGPCASGLFYRLSGGGGGHEEDDCKTGDSANAGNNGKRHRGENRLSRGLSRLFRRKYQTYHVNKGCRRSMSEINLTRMQQLSLDDDFQPVVVPNGPKKSQSFLYAKSEPGSDTEESRENKGQDSWVVVHKLKSQSDGGILDPDDKLVDVADDREQIMAIYEEDTDGMPSLQHNAGDGTSASSVGTNSPDIFQGNDHKFQPFARTDIEITGEELSSGPTSGSPSGGSLTLQVRRGSEPALNRLSPVHLSPPDPSKRWSAAPVIDEDVEDSRTSRISSVSVIDGYSQRQVEGLTNRSNATIVNGHGKGEKLSVVSNSVVSSNTIEVHSTHYNGNAAVSQQRLNSYSVNSNQIYSAATTTGTTNGDLSNYSQQQQQQQSSNGHANTNNGDASSSDVSLPRSASAGSATLNRNISGGGNVASNGVQLRLNPSKSNSHLTSQSSGSRFSRDQNRLSMQITTDGGARWADAADRALCLSLRKEPLGANASPETPTDSLPPPGAFSTPILYSSTSDRDSFPVYRRERDHQGGSMLERQREQEDDTEYLDDEESSQFSGGRNSTVVYNSNGNMNTNVDRGSGTGEVQVLLTFKYEAEHLGIHIAPEHLPTVKNQGLIVQGVKPGSRIDRDGRLQAGDKIIEINGHSLIGVPMEQAKLLFKEGLSRPEIQLRVVKGSYNIQHGRHFGEGVNGQSETAQSNEVNLTSVSVHNLVQKFNNGNGEASHEFQNGEMEEKENMIQGHEQIVGDAKVATVSPTKKLPLQVQAVPLTRPASSTAVIASNTRKIGRKYEIDLQKGSQGLGFSVTTRDNPAGGNTPIYIKNILPTGAAIDDGRLRPGDRLLEVNGIEITGKSQSEAVSILRSVPQGGIVKLVVSRQERVDLSPKLPRQIPPEKINEEIQPVPWGEREVLGLDIPVLDTEKAGLGISVKGKTQVAQKGNMVDMGIYIKSVIHGGAASRDGRLKSNDQLLSINGVSLLDRSNQDAMETLRKTMTQDGPKPKPGFITLTIARRVPSSSAPTTDISGCGSSASGDEMDSWGSRNVSMSADGNKSGESADHPAQVATGQDQGNTVFLPAYTYIPQQNEQPQSTNSQHQYNQQEHPSTPQQGLDMYQQFQNQQRLNASLSPAVPINSFPIEMPRNPVLDRLTGKSAPAARSESYYRATNETYNTTLIQSMVNNRNGREQYGQIRGQSVTVQTRKGEMVLLEDDYAAPQKPPRRSRSSTPDDTLNPPTNGRKSEMMSPVVSPTGEPAVAFSEATYASQTSLEDSGGFSRDAFGRQSMSEKRHATLDAKNTDTYQRNKKLREERERQKQMHFQQEAMNDKKHAEARARELNLQDELARRGVKRPLSSSTEDNMMFHSSGHRSPTQQYGNYGANRYPSGGGGVDGAKFQGQRVGSSPEMTSPVTTGAGALVHSPSSQLPQEGRHTKARKGFGDQLIELFHHWGQKNQTRGEGALQRVNSADSLADVVKLQQQEQQRHKSPKSRKSHQKENEVEFKLPKTDIGPNLGMKKSSSLESLQTMVQEITTQEDVKSGYGPVRAGPAAVRVVRGRGCNESFRQAVDRSYEAPLGELQNQMETLAEEETESCISGATYGQLQRLPYSEPSESEVDTIYGKTKGAKKKPSILRGLGSMFRFGRHRKSGSGGLSAAGLRKQQAEIERQEREELEEAEKEKARQAAQTESIRIQEQYRRLLEKQKAEAQQGNNANSNYGVIGNSNQNPTYGQTGMRQHQLRKSMENQSIRERERERERREQEMRDVNGNHFQQPAHLRSASYDVYNEMTRPGSRVGFADPKKYTHYINYEEIQQHLNVDKANGNLSEDQIRQMRQTVIEQRKKAILESRRHQQHYHSQRREHPKQRQDRPVSNFYEYESVQAAMHAQQGSPVRNGHSHNHQSPVHVSDSRSRNQPEPQQHQHQQMQQPIYGSSTYGHTGMTNNGITLPSPSTMLPAVHQRSASQFQAQTMPNQSRQQIYYVGPMNPGGNSGTLQPQSSQNKFPPQQQPHPNSLPRRSQKDMSTGQMPQQVNSTSHRHPHQQQIYQQQQQQISGRYLVPSHQPSNSNVSQNYRSLQPSNASTQRLQPSASHMHSHPSGMVQMNHPNMSLGSKV